MIISRAGTVLLQATTFPDNDAVNSRAVKESERKNAPQAALSASGGLLELCFERHADKGEQKDILFNRSEKSI